MCVNNYSKGGERAKLRGFFFNQYYGLKNQGYFIFVYCAYGDVDIGEQ